MTRRWNVRKGRERWWAESPDRLEATDFATHAEALAYAITQATKGAMS